MKKKYITLLGDHLCYSRFKLRADVFESSTTAVGHSAAFVVRELFRLLAAVRASLPLRRAGGRDYRLNKHFTLVEMPNQSSLGISSIATQMKLLTNEVGQTDDEDNGNNTSDTDKRTIR